MKKLLIAAAFLLAFGLSDLSLAGFPGRRHGNPPPPVWNIVCTWVWGCVAPNGIQDFGYGCGYSMFDATVNAQAALACAESATGCMAVGGGRGPGSISSICPSCSF